MSEDTQNVATPAAAEVRENHRKVRVGTVVSDKQDKTRVVAVARTAPDPLYKKVIKHTTKFYVHDENNESKIGDVVRIMETRPLSKMKRWRLVEIQKHADTD
jgi:small subunit ribosomal protein S17